MRAIDEISTIAEVEGPTVAAVAAAVRAMADMSRGGWCQAATWAIGERCGRGWRTVRRAIVRLVAAGVIEVEEDCPVDAFQRANRYLWRGVGQYERQRVRQARLARREAQRRRRLILNNRKRWERERRQSVTLWQRVRQEVDREIAKRWRIIADQMDREASISAPVTGDRAIPEGESSEMLRSGERCAEALEMRRRRSG